MDYNFSNHAGMKTFQTAKVENDNWRMVHNITLIVNDLTKGSCKTQSIHSNKGHGAVGY